MNIDLSNSNIIRLFVFFCFYAAFSYSLIAWKYLNFFKVKKALRQLLVFIHAFIVISNIIFFLIFVLIDKHFAFSVILSFFGLSIAIIGVLFIVLSILTLKKATFIPPEKRTLITNGLYKISSHPIYFGGILAAFGLAIWRASMLGLVYALVILLSLIIISKIEEKDLIARFGEDYLEYKKRTFLGKLSTFITGESHRNH